MKQYIGKNRVIIIIFLSLIAVIFVLMIAQIICIPIALRYVDNKYLGLKNGMSRESVRSELSSFTEYEVKIEDIPKGYREGFVPDTALVNTAKIFRYDFRCLFIVISFHVLYDECEDIIFAVPTYE